jgi:hypothetical protein
LGHGGLVRGLAWAGAGGRGRTVTAGAGGKPDRSPEAGGRVEATCCGGAFYGTVAARREARASITEIQEDTMAGWHIQGEYMETCNCSYICPCIGSNLADTPTEGDCKVAIAMRIDKGEKDGVSLDGVPFVVVMLSPGAMIEGNFKVGLIVDDGASDAQVDAITAIATGAAGGPMAALGPLVGEFAGVERRPVSFEQDGMRYTVTAGELVDQSIEGVPSESAEGQPMYIDNTAHPVAARLALAKATRSRFNAFGISWDDASGTRNGHFAPFSWAA